MDVHHTGLTFERLGHASVRIETGDGRIIYIDPWSHVLDAEPHDADVVFSTHDDEDHYDPAAIEAVSNPETTIVAYEAIDTGDLGREVVALEYDGSLTAEGIEVQAVPAYNRSDGDHVWAEGEPYHAEGEVVGLLLTIDGTTVYFTSDTDFLDEHTDLRADVFIPPIGGKYTMDRHEAARFAESVDPQLVLPVHYNSDVFEEIDADATAFKTEIETDDRAVRLF